MWKKKLPLFPLKAEDTLFTVNLDFEILEEALSQQADAGLSRDVDDQGWYVVDALSFDFHLIERNLIG